MRKKGWDFSFDPKACQSCAGNCCIGESGYIWVDHEKIQDIAEHLGVSIDFFMQNYVVREPGGWSLTEVKIGPDNFRCVFFDVGKRACQIYSVRPKQCKTFPFWTHFMRYPLEVEEECPGITLDKKS